MTTPHLADYLMNNDYEIVAIERDYNCIAQNLEAEQVPATLEQIQAAVEIVLNDPYIKFTYGKELTQ